MNNKPNYVFDSNVIVSALILPKSVSRKAFDHAQDSGIILISKSILLEINETIYRPKFDKYIDHHDRTRFLALLTRKTKYCDVKVSIKECRDNKDNMFLELAIGGKANCIISGDKDLLDLHPYRGIPILNPTEFLNQFV